MRRGRALSNTAPRMQRAAAGAALSSAPPRAPLTRLLQTPAAAASTRAFSLSASMVRASTSCARAHSCSPRAQAQKFRAERDTFGDLQVPADRYWGAQTQR
jgi:hypothetical protein